MKSGTINGFRALPLKLNEETKNPHYIYFKEHSVREKSEDKPSGRTLFIVNIPPYVSGEGIKNAFSNAGKITSVKFHTKPSTEEILEPTKDYFSTKSLSTFRIAYAVFEKVSELDKALTLKNLKSAYDSTSEPKFGIKKWVEEYNASVPFTKTLKKEIDDFIKRHDELTEEAAEKEKELEKEDDEGWVTVTKKGNVASFARTENVEKKVIQKEALKKKKKELKNFYTFQIRESKMKNIVALRQKFEEDKKKIAHIKQSRRFKPF